MDKNQKRFRLLATAFCCLLSLSALAGGLMTNTNYHIAFDRMMARGASLEIDAIYSNPAGLAWTHEGWELSFNWQVPGQNRDIDTYVPNYLGAGEYHHKYAGKASAPFVPGLFASWRKDRLAIGFMAGIVGSGGYVRYDEGIPMLNIPVAEGVAKALSTMQIPNPQTMFRMDSWMKGKQYIYGAQIVGAYRILDNLSVSAGLRASYYDGYYRGRVAAIGNDLIKGAIGTDQLMAMELNCDQRGWGFSPIIGIDFHTGKLTLAAKYEFRTKLNIPNTTNSLSITRMGQTIDVKAMAEKMGNEAAIAALAPQMNGMEQMLAPYLPDAKTRYDMPALLTVAAGYEFLSNLRATVEYHFFDDKNAKMANNRQEKLTHGTHEILAGVEWDINKMFTVSCGGQRTDYGLSDEFQQNTSFACDSYSIGFGGAMNVTEKLRINASFFWTMYSDYTHKQATRTDTYSRTNNVFGMGVDYKF